MPQNQPKGKSFQKFIFIAITLIAIGTGCFLFFGPQKQLSPEKMVEKAIKDDRYAIDAAEKLFCLGEIEKCMEVLNASAEKGNIKSQAILGDILLGDTNVKLGEFNWTLPSDKSEDLAKFSDIDKSAYWLLKSAKAGYGPSMAKMSMCYKFGYGVDQNFEKCLRWAKAGAEIQDPESLRRLGHLYANGLAIFNWKVPGSPVEQVWLYLTSIDEEQGTLKVGDPLYYVVSKRNSRSYVNKDYIKYIDTSNPIQVFLEKDTKTARKYWEKAAELGDQVAKDQIQKVFEGDDE